METEEQTETEAYEPAEKPTEAQEETQPRADEPAEQMKTETEEPAEQGRRSRWRSEDNLKHHPLWKRTDVFTISAARRRAAMSRPQSL